MSPATTRTSNVRNLNVVQMVTRTGGQQPPGAAGRRSAVCSLGA
jgi:hypothetical protein